MFFILTHSYLLHPLHLMRISGPLSRRRIISLACIWHISAPRTCTHITCSQVHPPQLTHGSLDLCLRATSVCMPLSHQLVCFCHDLSRACIGMFKRHFLHPYYTDDLWITVHRLDMVHHLCHLNRLTILEFRLSSFLTPKRMKRFPSIVASFPTD